MYSLRVLNVHVQHLQMAYFVETRTHLGKWTEKNERNEKKNEYNSQNDYRSCFADALKAELTLLTLPWTRINKKI